jgi:hypothetical protein
MKLVIKLIAAAAVIGAAPVSAAPVIINVSGTAGSAGAYTGTLNLDVDNGMVTAATGTLSIAGLTDAQLGLVTTSTPGNNPDQAPRYPIGFRANDGTDLIGADLNYPLDQGGLLFTVGSDTPVRGEYPLINFYNNGTNDVVLFTGLVNGTEYYAQSGSLNITEASSGAVPEPASWAMMILGVGAVGYAMRRRKAAVRVSYAA